MKLVNERFPTEKLKNVDTNFMIDSTYEKELMATLPLTRNALHKAEMQYHENLDILLEGSNRFLL